MKSPWKAIQPMLPDHEYLVLASSIPPRSRTSTRALFAGAGAVRKQLAEAEGLIGFSLLARPMRKQYATLSVWEEERALDRFANQTPHRELVAALAPAMAPTTFVRWTTRGEDGHPSWRDALRRLG